MRLPLLVALGCAGAGAAAHQAAFAPPSQLAGTHPLPPRVDHAAGDAAAAAAPAPGNMTLHALSVSGPSDARVNLVFFADGYTASEAGKFLADAQRLTDDVVAADSAMAHVRDLLNVWAVFVPSEHSGVGTHSAPLAGAAFGLYRPGPELRAVYVEHAGRARAACRHFAEAGTGCDQAIMLGNDPLYGGLGGDLTVITASPLNGPLVLRHELGHSLISVGEEYEGGYAYFGANSAPLDAVGALPWAAQLSPPARAVVQDAQVPLQAYPWHDLTTSAYAATWRPNSTHAAALLRLSVSGIAAPDQLAVSLNGRAIDLSASFPASWHGSADRRWLEAELDSLDDSVVLVVELTAAGRDAPAPQGGKMVSSVEVITYGPDFERADGFVGAFPTYAMDRGVTLRPTNEGCLMRKVNHPLCAAALERSLKDKIKRKQRRLEP